MYYHPQPGHRLPQVHRTCSPRVITHRHPAGITPGKPIIRVSASAMPYHAPLLTSFPMLDWDQDPRLLDLGKVLRSLGWVRG
jgi:hypothetical protein